MTCRICTEMEWGVGRQIILNQILRQDIVLLVLAELWYRDIRSAGILPVSGMIADRNY